MQQKTNELIDTFVSKKEFKESVNLKLESDDFNAFKKRLMENKETEEAYYRLDQKIFAIERRLLDFVPKGTIDSNFKTTAPMETLNIMRENLHKL